MVLPLLAFFCVPISSNVSIWPKVPNIAEYFCVKLSVILSLPCQICWSHFRKFYFFWKFWKIETKNRNFFLISDHFIIFHHLKISHSKTPKTPILVNDELKIELHDLNYRADDSVLIHGMHYNTFFGGSDITWAPVKNENAFFKNFAMGEFSDSILPSKFEDNECVLGTHDCSANAVCSFGIENYK